jgi:hypothetical protein
MTTFGGCAISECALMANVLANTTSNPTSRTYLFITKPPEFSMNVASAQPLSIFDLVARCGLPAAMTFPI